MASPPRSEHYVVPASTIRDDKIDIVFVDKKGNISLVNSFRYGNETPAPSTRPTLSSRSPTDASTGANKHSAITHASPSSRASIDGSQHQAIPAPTARNSSQGLKSEGRHPGSDSVLEDSLDPDQILVEGEEPLAATPKDSYFTLIWLDRFYEGKAALNSEGNDQPAPRTTKKDVTLKKFENMDDSYFKVLKSLGLCGHCKDQAEEILWRNIREYESRYETRCRTCEDEKGVCFLKFHTMQAPYLNKSNFILALVHHIKILKTPAEGYYDPEEHIFAFVLGLKACEIGKLFTSLRCYWETTILEPKEVGLTKNCMASVKHKLPYWILLGHWKPSVTSS